MGREKLFNFLLRMKREDGSFRMHHEGETDVRCAIFVSINNVGGAIAL
jgi:prenyltransferase beta subunit